MIGDSDGGRQASYPLGVVMVLVAGLFLSLGGIIVRQIDDASGWQLLFYRSLAFVVTVLIFIAVRYRGRIVGPFQSIGRHGTVIALSLGIGSTCYVFALILTTVANAVFIISSAPFFTAVAGWLVLRERVAPSTWIAMCIALCGIGLMFADGFVAGRTLGNVVAVGVVASFAVMLIALRQAKHIDMLPATCLGGVVAAIIGAVMSEGLVISGHDLAMAILMGSVQFGGGFILITLGARHVPAAEVALLSLAETVLAPVWVWLGVNEVPSTLTVAGGAVVLAALAGRALVSLREKEA